MANLDKSALINKKQWKKEIGLKIIATFGHWIINNFNHYEQQKEKIHSRMLFDHHIDPEENKNRVNERKYRSEINKLSSFLKAKKETLMKSQWKNFPVYLL